MKSKQMVVKERENGEFIQDCDFYIINQKGLKNLKI